MAHRSLDEPARFLAQQLYMRRRARLADDLALIAEHVPEIVSDARHCLAASPALPWERTVAFQTGIMADLIEKDGVSSTRQRPDSATISPITKSLLRNMRATLPARVLADLTGILTTPRPPRHRVSSCHIALHSPIP